MSTDTTQTSSQPTSRPGAGTGGTALVLDQPAELHTHYTSRHDEARRLTSTLKGQLETERVHEMLTRYLVAPPARIADIGGGPGEHAVWLQGQGYQVDLLDPVQRHVDQAAARGVSARLGDARDLPWRDDSFDAAWLAGPLYHLVDAADRRLALREASRIVRPGGVIAVLAINRVANLIGSAIANTLLRRREVVEQILTDGHSPANERMAHCHYHSVTQLRTELSHAGLRPVTIHGLTGPGGWLTVAIDAHYGTGPLPPSLSDPDPLQTALTCTRLADGQPELTAASSLLFAVGRTD